jgi:excisionase family DNA binding protein
MAKKKTTEVNGEAPDDLITQSEAAQLKGADISTVGQWVRRGRIRSFEKYGRRLVSRSEVEAYNPQNNKGGRPPKAKTEAASKASKKRGGKK